MMQEVAEKPKEMNETSEKKLEVSENSKPSDLKKIFNEVLKSAVEAFFDKQEHPEENSVETNHSDAKENDALVEYYDDNGNLYRIGDDLIPNASYEINGYTSYTDDLGRITSVEGTLHMKEHEGRQPMKDSLEAIGKGDEKEGDDRGHLIGDQFGGSNGLENMIPQDATINRGDFKNFENELAKHVKAGDNVTVKIEPIYEGGSRRPTAIVVTYTINGDQSVRVFPNEKGNKNES